MSRFVCPACRTAFESEGAIYLPFCSERCKLIDLRRWLGEEYSMPVEREPELEDYRQQESD